MNEAQVAEFFGDQLKPLKGTRWTKGGSCYRFSYLASPTNLLLGIPSRGFGGWGSGGFSKAIKHGAVDVHVQSMEVNYSKNNMKCTLKFDVQIEGMDDYSDDDY